MNDKRVVFFIIFFLLLIPIYGQRMLKKNAGWSIKERLYYGGGFGVNGGGERGSNFFYLALNPIVGYMITKDFSAGVGIDWQWTSYITTKQNYHAVGFGPFLRYNFGRLAALVEYNYAYFPSSEGVPSIGYSRLLIGALYAQPIGKRLTLNLRVLYDILHNSQGARRQFASPFVFGLFLSYW